MGGAMKKKKPTAGKGAKKPAAKKPAAKKPAAKKDASKKPTTIKDRIRHGAKVHVGERGGIYIVYDGKKHPICS